MKYRNLGNSGLKVSEIGFGTNNFGTNEIYPSIKKTTNYLEGVLFYYYKENLLCPILLSYAQVLLIISQIKRVIC